MIDLHTHHERCGHATGSLQDYVEQAIENGITILGFSDHAPFFAEDADQPLPHVAMARSQFADYVREAADLREKYRKDIRILIGTEADYVVGGVNAYRSAITSHKLDYSIGSVHMFQGLDVFDRSRWDRRFTDRELVELKSAYFRAVADCAATGVFQVMGHVDAIKGSFPRIGQVAAGAAADDMLRAIRAGGAALEINTSGGTKDCGGWYPSLDIIERAAHFGVRVTFASDAHTSSRVGESFNEVLQTLRAVGFREWTIYERGEAISIPFA